ncbi:hypothetical protein [Aureimonas sp. D3]|uniref:hypothetical protein n=1 Tax=Aureimonas sp. D3 TaxID=1638164 RepID=UPI00078496D8|nr:hypothetical protein [Aureimonas sp. D3]
MTDNTNLVDAIASFDGGPTNTAARSLEDAIASFGFDPEAVDTEGSEPGPDAAPAAPSPEPDTTLTDAEMTAEEKAVTPGYYAKHGEPGLGRPSPGPFALADAGEAALLGAASGVLEMKDLFGEPEGGRPWLDKRRDEINEHSPIIGPVAQGIGQFAVGIYGLGKLNAAAKVVPWFGRGLQAAETALHSTTKGKLAAELGRDALAVFITSDPHTERLANLLEGTPYIGPVADFLAAKPDDGAMEGRLKASLEGLGMDVALRGALVGSLSVFKWYWYGNAEKAAKAAAKAQAETRAAVMGEPEPAAMPDLEDPSTVDFEAGGLGGTEPPRTSPAPTAPAPERTPTADPRFTGSRSFTDEPEDVAEALRTAVRTQSALDPASIKKIDTAFNKFELTPEVSDLVDQAAVPAPEGFTVRRGVLGGEEELFETFGNKSSVMQGAAADGFGSFKGSKGTVAEIAIQPGTRIFAPNSDIKGGEILFAKDTQFTIVGKAEDGTLQVVAEPRALEPRAMAEEATPGATISEAANAAEDLPVGSVPGSTSTISPAFGVRLSLEDTGGLLAAMRSDADAIAQYGSRQAARNAGHEFGRGDSIPYAKLQNPEEVNDFLARVVDAEEEYLDTTKGGAVLRDADVEAMAKERAQLFGEDPATFLGMMDQMAKASRQLAPAAQAGALVIKRLSGDLTDLARRLSFEDYSAFPGGRVEAFEEFARRHALLVQVHAATGSITSNSARTTRIGGSRLAVNAADAAAIQIPDVEKLIGLYANSDGSPASIAKLANPSLLSKGLDAGRTFLINNLISGWTTMLVNGVSNGVMVGVRPLERIIGAAPRALAGNTASQRIFRQSLQQYTYMAAGLMDGFQSAVKAFATKDSVMAPHTTELYRAARGPAQGLKPATWEPWDTLGGALRNTLVRAPAWAMVEGNSLPTRISGFTDELAKQTIGRSYVAAEAHVDGVGEALRLGLKGGEAKAFVRDFVSDKLAQAFDASGRLVHKKALEEAQVGTFSQDLLPGTIGHTVQMAKTRHPGLGFILPFTKTPTNLLRYGWKMTPGLNTLQGEYRAMLKGEKGAEAQAQAMGQMALGTSAMLATASLASLGYVTGGGPSDPKARQELLATGWQPYSVVVPNADGTKSYVSYGRIDPVAIPLGIVVDLQDAMATMGEDMEDASTVEKLGTAGVALLSALTKQFQSKSYAMGFSQFLNAIIDPDERAGPYAGQMASDFVPFASMLRQTDGDPYMRDARDFVDKILATVPGLGEGLPARYDAFGDPIRQRNGLWSSDAANIVDQEVQRLAVETGSTPGRPSPRGRGGVDLRDLTMIDGEFAGRNAYVIYQELGGHLPGMPSLKELAADVIQGEEYQIAPDGDARTDGTKLSILTDIMRRYRSEAMAIVMQDSAVAGAAMRKEDKARTAYEARAEARAAGLPMPRNGRPGLGEAFGVNLSSLFGGGEGATAR